MKEWNGLRWDGRSGHYESWFQRANHPTKPQALWIRHTLFTPNGRPEAAEGEIWSVWFDGDNKPIAAKTELPRRDCSFDSKGLDVKMPGAQLKPGALTGGTGRLKWDLTWANAGPPMLLLPEALYAGSFPKAKTVCIAPNGRFFGTYQVDGQTHAIDSWPGSHNHNWGSRHYDRYSWAQVCGFDGAPDVFLECGTGQVMVGPVMTPKVTVVMLQLEGRRLFLNSLFKGALARAEVGGLGWKFSTADHGVELEVAVDAPAQRFAALRYRNPPGGAKACLNSKIARCTLTVREQGHSRTFTSAHGAAFEILCDEHDPRVAQVGGFQV